MEMENHWDFQFLLGLHEKMGNYGLLFFSAISSQNYCLFMQEGTKKKVIDNEKDMQIVGY